MTVYINDPDLTIHIGDALTVLSGLPDASVDCCVTSPPYANARPDIAGVPADEFAEWLTPILGQLHRVVTTTGSLMLNLGRVFRDYQEHPYVFDTLYAARSVGWQHAETVIWYKPNALPLSGPYLVPRHEYVWWLAKDARVCYRGIDETRQPHSPESIARYGRGGYIGQRKGVRAREVRPLHPDGARAGSVFTCHTGAEKGNSHPTPMPVPVAAHLVALSCPPNGCVLDPFLGSGTTALVARRHGRRTIGIELNPEYARLAAERCQQLSLLAEAAL
jgi:DNA modification methylase